jgi:hypothetical protein
VLGKVEGVLRKCPHHGLELGVQMQTFHSGLNFASEQLVDTSVGGTTSTKILKELYELVENIVKNNHSWENSRPRARV